MTNCSRSLSPLSPCLPHMSLRVAILTDEPGWHGRELQRAFRALGVHSAFASLSDCRIDLEGSQPRVLVYNDARAIERSVDKAMTTFLLRRQGIPTLPTWVTERESVARGILMR